ncbi:MAG: peptidoglycan editing factor PgeF [Gammaproteobacteria bacterium]|nr:peptidoglycan editing factor PgeF [Gammaproteobacteria bacterium]
MDTLGWLLPDWPAPPQVRALMTTRLGGVSLPPYASMNLATHVGDNIDHVKQNRQRLRQILDLSLEPLWLNQIHGTHIVDVASATETCDADGSFARGVQRPCVVMTADCLPLLICDSQGTQVAAVHAGWRGLLNGAVEAAIVRFDAPVEELLVWMGVAIGPEYFEVGDEVREAFLLRDPNAGEAFVATSAGKWLANIYLLARLRLASLGITAVYGAEGCSYADERLFFSYRRQRDCGRMAALIWIQE